MFDSQEDDYLRNLVHYTKDIEAGSLYWTRKLSDNDRRAAAAGPGKALIPCTPLAIVKLLDAVNAYSESPRPASGKTATIFNRSQVIGRPLAVMLSNDGARVFSFDINGPLLFLDGRPRELDISRARALQESDIVITGVPDPAFRLIRADELKADCVYINFASIRNHEPEVPAHVRTFVPRVGPMTVAMCMRNAIRLYRNFHQ